MEGLTLKNILNSFNAPLNESQAWAVCYQCGTYLLDLWQNSPEQCQRFNGVTAVYISKDGNVVKVAAAADGDSRPTSPDSSGRVRSENELVQSLGVVVFQALDYGLGESEEQTISPALEGLLDRMTGAESDHDNQNEDDRHDDDEGIEHDAEDEEIPDPRDKISLGDVIQACCMHVQNPREAPQHYKAVCRALVTEASELTTFLEKISTEKERLKFSCPEDDHVDGATLDDLQRADWARLWIQVMKQLRHGVQLKASDNLDDLQHTHYALTPYEMMMKDIRSRRYTLNKVMVDGNLPPSTKKDAHDIILDFIRSRPPLHPVKNRKLPPLENETLECNVRDRLMNDIRSDHNLRPTPGNIVETSRARLNPDDESSPMPLRKVIKADFTLNFDSEEESDEDFDDDYEDRRKVTPSPIGSLTPLSPKTPTGTWKRSVVRELVRFDSHDFAVERRHSITVCETPTTPNAKVTPPTDYTSGSQTYDRWRTHAASRSGRSSSMARSPSGHRNSIAVCETPTSPGSSLLAPGERAEGKTQQAKEQEEEEGDDDAFESLTLPKYDSRPRSLQTSLECLSLTIEEVMHIRGVLTKAELECHVVDPELHMLLDKGKVCFTCKKTRFSIFGQWSTKCRFCKRNVCARCSSKMRIPTEHFEHIPVYTLSPSPMTPDSERQLFTQIRTGSAPNSPETRRRSLHLPQPQDPSNNNKSGVASRPNVTSRPDVTSQPDTARPAPSRPDMPSRPGVSLGPGAHNMTSRPGVPLRPAALRNSPLSSSMRMPGSVTAGDQAARRRAQLQRSATLAYHNTAPPPRVLQGPMMCVCKDCKAMIVSIIRSSRHSLASAPNAIQRMPFPDIPSRKVHRNFHLDLKPVYK